jgi:hypothetical protein
MFRPRHILLALSAALGLVACGGGGGGGSEPSPPAIVVSVSGQTTILATGATRTFSATVLNTSNTTVTWDVLESGGGSVTAAGVYTAPAIPGTYRVRATSQADPTKNASIGIPVIIPEGEIPGYEVGVDYHSTGTDFVHTAFITTYNQPAVRNVVLAQLQGMADRGATIVSTRVWLVTEPGTTDFGETWRATFPLSDQEQSNLRSYAQDVAAVQGSGGNRLRLDLCLLWLGAADYTMGTPTTGLGFTPITAAEFTRRVETTTDEVLTAVTGINRPDGLPVVRIIYLDGEVMMDAPGQAQPKANATWFMTTHYPRFVQVVGTAGFTPSVYFITADTQADVTQADYVDAVYPALNGHRSAYWLYRTLKFMKDNALPIPARIDFSYYVPSETVPTGGVTYSDLLTRALDDADAALSTLGIASSYGAAETFYFPDSTQRRAFGQAFAAEASAHTRLHQVTFWTSPDGGGSGVDNAYPFAIEDYLLTP